MQTDSLSLTNNAYKTHTQKSRRIEMGVGVVLKTKKLQKVSHLVKSKKANGVL